MTYDLGRRNSCHGPIPGFRPMEELLQNPDSPKQEFKQNFHGDYSLYTDEMKRLFRSNEDRGACSPIQSQIGRDLKDAVSPNNSYTYQLFKSPEQSFSSSSSTRSESTSTSPVPPQPAPVDDLIPTTRYCATNNNGSSYYPASSNNRATTYSQLLGRPLSVSEESNLLGNPLQQQQKIITPQKPLTTTVSPRVAAAAQAASILFPPVTLGPSINNCVTPNSSLGYGEAESQFLQYNNTGLNGVPSPPQSSNQAVVGASRSVTTDVQLAGLSLSSLTNGAQRRRLRFSSNGSAASCTSDEVADDFVANGIETPDWHTAVDLKQLFYKMQVNVLYSCC